MSSLRQGLSAALSFSLIFASISPAAAAARTPSARPLGPVRAAPLPPSVLQGLPSLAAPAAAPAAAAAALPQAVRPAQLPARAAAQAQAPAAAHLRKAAASEIAPEALFDNARVPANAQGLLPLPAPSLPQGLELDEIAAPDARRVGGVSINAFDIPGARDAGGIFDIGPRVLNADPRNADAVRDALLDLVDQDAARWGVTRDELRTIHAKRVEGKNGLADTIYVFFRQTRSGYEPDGAPFQAVVDGSYLSFTVQVIKGRPVLRAAMANLYPNLGARMDARFFEPELRVKAERLLPQGAGVDLSFVERKVVFRRNTQSWHAVSLYAIESLPGAEGVLAAVDIHTGDVFAWDGRHGLVEAGGKIDGRLETSDKRPGGEAELRQLPLGNLHVSVAGKTATTDADGRFRSESKGDAPATFTATLSGKYVQVNDRAGQPAKVSATLVPGQEVSVVFNEAENNELQRSQANVYWAINNVYNWVTERIGYDKRIDRQIPANVNINQECNAYYTPGRPSVNFFRSSANCSDTARPGIIYHEWGHYLDDMIGGIMNGGLSEGWGDILSMYILGSPIVGEGFLKRPRDGKTTWIRHGENDYQYGRWDPVHTQGQAWMGFAWRLRKALMDRAVAEGLEAAAGAAWAEAVVLPTIFAKAADIPSAIAQVLLNATDADGNIRYEAEIRAAAKAHGIVLPQSPGRIATLARRLASSTGELKIKTASIAPAALRAAPEGAAGALALASSGRQPGPGDQVRGKLQFSAGLLIRGQVKNALRRYLDAHDVKYELKEYKGLLSSDFLLVIEGPYEEVKHRLEQVQRLLAAAA